MKLKDFTGSLDCGRLSGFWKVRHAVERSAQPRLEFLALNRLRASLGTSAFGPRVSIPQLQLFDSRTNRSKNGFYTYNPGNSARLLPYQSAFLSIASQTVPFSQNRDGSMLVMEGRMWSLNRFDRDSRKVTQNQWPSEGRRQQSPASGGSFAPASRATFQVPSGCLRQMVMKRPLMFTGFPLASLL